MINKLALNYNITSQKRLNIIVDIIIFVFDNIILVVFGLAERVARICTKIHVQHDRVG